jgi:hypothetical protein
LALEVFYSGRAALEATRGTDLTPTRLIYFDSCTEEQDVATIRPAEHRNSYNAYYAATAGREQNVLTFTGKLSFNDAAWWAQMFFKSVPSGTGGGADKTYAFLPSAATDDVKSTTFQLAYADTIATAPGYKYNYALGQTFNLHFEKGDDAAVTFKAALLAAKSATSIAAFTGALTDRSVVLASANSTIAYIDTTTIGSTADPKVISVDWTVDLGPVPLYTLDGTTAAQAIYRPKYRTWTATVTRQYDAANERSAYTAKTVRKLRIKTTGPTLGGSTYLLQLDLYGVYTGRRTGSVDGIVTEELTFEPVYDTASTSDHSLTVVTSETSIT